MNRTMDLNQVARAIIANRALKGVGVRKAEVSGNKIQVTISDPGKQGEAARLIRGMSIKAPISFVSR